MAARRRKGVRLELTPLLDVMFLVLVFFIYSIFDMTMHRGVKVDLPGAKGVEEKGDRVVVTILPDDTLQLDGVPLSRDRSASLGTGVSLLAELKARGITRVSFQVSGAAEP